MPEPRSVQPDALRRALDELKTRVASLEKTQIRSVNNKTVDTRTGSITLGLETLSDVDTSGKGDQDVLVWDDATSKFITGPSTPAVSAPSPMVVPFHADATANITMTNQANAEQFLANSNRNIVKADLTNYTQVRLLARVVTQSASVNSPRVYLEYSPSFTTTIGSFLTIGDSAVNCSLAATGLIDSGWVNLVAGAKADVFLAVLQHGGDAAADPALGPVLAVFK